MWTEVACAARELGCETATALPLSASTSFRIGGAAALTVNLPSAEVLPPLLRRLQEVNATWLTIGRGSNLLVRDEGFDGAVLRLPAGDVRVEGTRLTCAAGVPLTKLCRTALEAGLTGMEFAYGIPGSVGGALFMNAGAYGGQMADVVTGALVADEDGRHPVAAADMALGYRRSAFMQLRDRVIAEVTVTLVPGDREAIAARMEELLTRRQEKQPLEFPSAGSYFKRPTGYYAGALIEQCGLKGRRVGDAQVSEKHAGFVINRGHATCAEVLELERQVREAVEERFGVRLEREVQLVGGKD